MDCHSVKAAVPIRSPHSSSAWHPVCSPSFDSTGIEHERDRRIHKEVMVHLVFILKAPVNYDAVHRIRRHLTIRCCPYHSHSGDWSGPVNWGRFWGSCYL